MGLQTAGLCYAQPLNNGIFTACDKKFWLNSVYRKFFIYVHKNLFVPQTSDLLEKLALIFLYNFHHDHILLKLKIKKVITEINVKNIKTRV